MTVSGIDILRLLLERPKIDILPKKLNWFFATDTEKKHSCKSENTAFSSNFFVEVENYKTKVSKILQRSKLFTFLRKVDFYNIKKLTSIFILKTAFQKHHYS